MPLCAKFEAVDVMFETFEVAAEALLHKTCDVLVSKKVRFVIVGGWSPYLRGGKSGLQHPGTRDVDVLFDDEDRDVIEDAIKTMLSDGFHASAKHEFQLLRPLQVGDRKFVFNVDFMHPSEQRLHPELMADIFDLGVPDSSDPSGRRWIKSIVFQSARIVFDQGLYSYVDREGVDTDGSKKTTTIPLLNEAGLVLSKLNSVKQAKRPRDSFDIFYVLGGPKGHAAARQVRQLANDFDEIGEQVESLVRWLDANSSIFDRNVSRYTGNYGVRDFSSFVKAMLLADAPQSDGL